MQTDPAPTCSEFNSLVFDAAGDGNAQLLLAAVSAHGHLIDMPNPGEAERTPMHHASQKGHVAVIEALVQSGSRALHVPDRDGLMPLHYAAKHGHVPAIEALIRLGCFVDALSRNGWTPLYYATQEGWVAAIETLVRLGSTALDKPSRNNGATLMHSAAFYGHGQVIETLVRIGSRSIDASDIYGRTPMHVAVRAEQSVAIVALLRLGSRSINAVNKRGESPLYVSLLNGFPECTKLLRACGANPSCSLDRLPREASEQLVQAIPDDELADLRYPVYFAHSLVSRLLFAL